VSFRAARLKHDCCTFYRALFNEQILLREAPIYIVFPGGGGLGVICFGMEQVMYSHE
jgi:hypothetical protein